MNPTLKYAEEKAKQADKLVAELEKEIEKANKEVEKHGKEVEKVKTKSEAAEPMTKEEVDAIDITIDKADTQITEEVQK
ncbi:hypothetical protein QUF94_24860 [Peribacillus sp. NJ4]|uniref:hypothetical protein n=1 Tax=Peribacillus sp. NJ4 TaxID=3055862 RepID=UPI0025A1EE80|nr:hypothetical protein [Peribacillus sp. NJ4]MDM5214622.1 hypothetical protein [Peribacillus sp. NJ4]